MALIDNGISSPEDTFLQQEHKLTMLVKWQLNYMI